MFILINKPATWTSFDVVAKVRNLVNAKNRTKEKVGHAGTLDPFATGLLIVGVGRDATKRLDEFKKLPKTYEAALKLGEVSDTYDPTGKVEKLKGCLVRKRGVESTKFSDLDVKKINTVLKTFVGKQKQVPPMYSAKQVKGQRLYKLARQGKEIKRMPEEIEIYSIKLLDYTWPLLKIAVSCSTGTYIRSLANDIGAKLGVGAYCHELVRTRIGTYDWRDAQEINALDLSKSFNN